MKETPPPGPLLLLPGTRPGRDPERSIRRGPRRASPEEVAATQRERLLDGLVRTVADKGYARARVSDICAAAGVTRPVFYELFDGKEDAFVVAHRHGTDLLLRAMRESFAGGPDWPAAMRRGLATMLAILASAPAFAVTAVVEADAVGPAGRHERDRLLARFHPFFADAPTRPLPVPHDELVACAVGGAYTALHRWVDEGRTRELPELLPTLTYYVLAPFLGVAAAAQVAAVETPVAHVALRCATPDRPVIDATSTPFIHKRVDPAATPG
ncbi:TetR/AcrR family transcriptional regulator [Streptomyces sp. SL13]|uniref:TetR/AcrR family transcriptional regulator n=1 Tax=Streptantibioticus silvisoli TaxID=2705255 RepID=A0AA90H418_9ACTN|nr:TetR/AcrR family transcriptional regulator [Streptantibioticus silvisoli]MDI5968420.1 TetR/AcrR family transcriptional regulator [Streptantibioticus silvisoli]